MVEQIWDGKCPMHKYVDSVQLSNPTTKKLTEAFISTLYREFPEGSFETPTSDETEQVDPKK